MQLSKEDALDIAKRVFSDRTVEPYVEYKNLLIVTAIDENDPDEGDFDPYRSVNLETSEVREFSPMTDANKSELDKLWLAQH